MLARRRQSSDFRVNTRIITEQFGTDVLIYMGLLFVVLFGLFVTSSLLANRRRRVGGVGVGGVVEACWTFIREMAPGPNTNSFPLLRGAAYKMIVISACILTLCYEMYYQALLSESLLVDVGADLATLPYELLRGLRDTQNVVFQFEGARSIQLLRDEDDFSRLVQRVAEGRGGPKYSDDVETMVAWVDEHGDVGLLNVQRFVGLVARMTPEQCRRLQVVPQPLAQQQFTAIGMSPKLPEARRAHINQLVIERMPWTLSHESSLRLDAHCLKLLFPSEENGVSFHALTLHVFSGALWLLVLLSVVAMVVFVAELLHRPAVVANDRRKSSNYFLELAVRVETIDFSMKVKNKVQRRRLQERIEELRQEFAYDSDDSISLT